MAYSINADEEFGCQVVYPRFFFRPRAADLQLQSVLLLLVISSNFVSRRQYLTSLRFSLKKKEARNRSHFSVLSFYNSFQVLKNLFIWSFKIQRTRYCFIRNVAWKKDLHCILLKYKKTCIISLDATIKRDWEQLIFLIFF